MKTETKYMFHTVWLKVNNLFKMLLKKKDRHFSTKSIKNAFVKIFMNIDKIFFWKAEDWNSQV